MMVQSCPSKKAGRTRAMSSQYPAKNSTPQNNENNSLKSKHFKQNKYPAFSCKP